jgi:hypothetical protein
VTSALTRASYAVDGNPRSRVYVPDNHRSIVSDDPANNFPATQKQGANRVEFLVRFCNDVKNWSLVFYSSWYCSFNLATTVESASVVVSPSAR